MPRLHRVGILEPAGNPYARTGRQFEQVCQSLGLEPVSVEITPASEIGAAIAELVRERAQALVVPYESSVAERASEIVDAATERGLPTISDGRGMAREAGALIAYSGNEVEQDRIRAHYIDRILRGVEPSRLPVRQSTKFELVINLKTARALGLSVPLTLLLRADEVAVASDGMSASDLTHERWTPYRAMSSRSVFLGALNGSNPGQTGNVPLSGRTKIRRARSERRVCGA